MMLSILTMSIKQDDDLDSNFARDLGFALWRSPLRVKGKESQRIDVCVCDDR